MPGLIRSASLTNFGEVARKVGLDPNRVVSCVAVFRVCSALVSVSRVA